MKTTSKLRPLLRISFILIVMVFASSCITTEVIGSYHSDNLDGEECQQVSHWKYWWGIGGSDEIFVGPDSTDTVCPCEDGKLASTEVKSSFGDFLLTFVTVGIVNHRTVSFECAESDDGEITR